MVVIVTQTGSVSVPSFQVVSSVVVLVVSEETLLIVWFWIWFICSCRRVMLLPLEVLVVFLYQLSRWVVVVCDVVVVQSPTVVTTSSGSAIGIAVGDRGGIALMPIQRDRRCVGPQAVFFPA